jgi:hypothetical protein
MILKKSGKEKGKNYLKTSMKEIEKPSIKIIDIEKLKLITFKNIVEGSMSINGVTWNKIKRLKGKEKIKMLETIIIIEVIMWTIYLHNELIMLKVLDLFSGIGGFSLGLESTGHFETIAFCEKDQFCQKVLKKHWSNIPIDRMMLGMIKWKRN